MTGPVLTAPHDSLLDAATAMALADFEALAAGDAPRALRAFPAWLADASPDLTLHRIADCLDLDGAERSLVALLFAASLHEEVARRVTAAAGRDEPGVPGWLACRLIPGLSAQALAAGGALRQFAVVEVGTRADPIGMAVTLNPAVVDRLCGLEPADPRIAAYIAKMQPDAAFADLALSQELSAALAARAGQSLSPAVLTGPVEPQRIEASLARLGLTPHRLLAADIPHEPLAREALAIAWSREAAFDAAVLHLIAEEPHLARCADFANRVRGHVAISGATPTTGFTRPVRMLANGRGPRGESVERWKLALGEARTARLGVSIGHIANQFDLLPAEIDAACAKAAAGIDGAANGELAARHLWHIAGRTAVPHHVPGVSIVEPTQDWSDIVLAPPIEAALRRIETHVRHSTMVMDEWGFADRMGGRGRGIAVLFAGPSGTGKTMAAEVLASSLDLRLMLIDLSQIISKYIGETSKNIAAAFEMAERSGAVMVWNEGDAIWGARGSVGHATDRHVNAEVGDLLQRIEAFRGFTVVTTNMRQAIDAAFLRRFRFAIDFPMPAQGERLRLWQRAFPASAPIEDIEWQALASLPLSGGSIRNVALGSAFLAAEAGSSIGRELISAELAEELRKNDLSVPAIAWTVPQ